MKVAVRAMVDKESYYDFINSLHSSFKEEMGDELANNGPIETGEFRAAWQYSRESIHKSDYHNDSLPARFLQGTGEWGPSGHGFCAKNAPLMVFNWRAFGYSLFKMKCVRGINPESILVPFSRNAGDKTFFGGTGGTYNFIEMMNDMVKNGIEGTVRKMS